MCPKPNIPEPEKFQASKAPVFSDGDQRTTTLPKAGRRGTLLASPLAEAAQPAARGKTLLGL